MYKISTVPNIKRRIDYLAAIYYQVAIMCKDFEKSEDSIKAKYENGLIIVSVNFKEEVKKEKKNIIIE